MWKPDIHQSADQCQVFSSVHLFVFTGVCLCVCACTRARVPQIVCGVWKTEDVCGVGSDRVDPGDHWAARLASRCYYPSSWPS